MSTAAPASTPAPAPAPAAPAKPEEVVDVLEVRALALPRYEQRYSALLMHIGVLRTGG